MASAPAKSKTERIRKTTAQPLRRDAAQVVAILATGEPQAEVARLYGVSNSSVAEFAISREADIKAVAARIEAEVTDYAIAHKVNRIAEYDWLHQKIKEQLEAGYDHVNVRELRATLRAAAEELAQLPRPTVEINEHKTYILQVMPSGGSLRPLD